MIETIQPYTLYRWYSKCDPRKCSTRTITNPQILFTNPWGDMYRNWKQAKVETWQ